ncbi:MAG: ATP-binding protein [Chromatiaceae bacterium]|nr:ATP-binding protein [Chromatiaceae bacterium]
MLYELNLKNVGPAPTMSMELARRLNLITGDNGLGKSFLLDVMWWAFTRRWPKELNKELTSGYPARPIDPRKPAAISFRLDSKTRPVAYESEYSPREEAWTGRKGRPWMPGLIIYAHSDGGFSVWDPTRNYWITKGNVDVQERIPAYVFSPAEVWDGLELDDGKTRTVICNGLLRDWASWLKEKGEDAALMQSALARLAPSGEAMTPGPLVRLSVNDARDIPTLKMPYADAVPILHASAGIRRAAALAYVLTWSWSEHKKAAQQLGEQPTKRIVMLFDEIESHLHPRWQRTILGSVLDLSRELHGDVEMQLAVATHSPLVLASAEPFFDPSLDRLFHLELMDNAAVLAEVPWAKQGDVVGWLVSDVFGLRQGRSIDAEQAVEAAEAWMRGDQQQLPEGLRSQAEIQAELERVLAGHDPFWPRWIVSAPDGNGASGSKEPPRRRSVIPGKIGGKR